MSQVEAAQVELDRYFERIAYADRPHADLATLRTLHLAHATHIPFENIDVLLGLPIRLDLASLEAKLVTGRRGGYCFEQNTLFAGVLEQLGFNVRRLQARVRVGTERILPLTHMALEVSADGASWLADVGFGAWGLLEPIPLVEGESRQFVWDYRLLCAGDVWTLQAHFSDAWQNLYSFHRVPHYPVDYEPANYYVSHHTDSRFVHTLTAQLPRTDTRYLLNNRDLLVAREGAISTQTLSTDDELLAVLREQFRLDVPAGTWLPKPLAV